jgi:hypothetical protein
LSSFFSFLFFSFSFPIFLLLFSFFRAPKPLLEILTEVVTKGYLELYCITKGASNG